MKTNGNVDDLNLNYIVEQIKALSKRVSSLEDAINSEKVINLDPRYASSNSESEFQERFQDKKESGDSWIETKLGEIGLGLLGNIVLLFCIVFLMTYTQILGYRLFPTIIGFASVAGVAIFSFYNRKSYPVLSKMLSVSSQLLLYYIIFKLHFFVDDPIVKSKTLDIILLFIPIGIQLYYAIKNKLELVIGMAMFLMTATALFYDTYHPSLIILVLVAGLSFTIFMLYSWWRFLIVSIFLVYIAHGLWMWDNPIMGGTGQLLPEHHFNMIYLFIYGSIFSFTLLLKYKEQIKDTVFIALTLINAFCFSLVLLSNLLAYFEDNYYLTFILISFYCIAFSVVIKSRTSKLFAPAFYACFGFMALSAAVYGYFGFPDTYPLLAFQSLLVASIALWYQSRIIVVTNTLLYAGILLTYLFVEEHSSAINFIFAIVALASARLLNWKKERLKLQTEYMRNFYLFFALGMLLFALYGSVPPKFVSLSWIAASGLFFLLSVFLRNVKYRWLGFIGILSTIIYLLLVDLVKMDIGYKVVVFLLLAILSISVSVYYTRRTKKKDISQ